jgi:hypothetical protein
MCSHVCNTNIILKGFKDMYNSKDLSYESADGSVCENCGKVAFSYTESVAGKKSGIGFAIAGWLFSIISLLFVPILFGTLAFALGLITYYGRSKSHGMALMVFAAISFVLGSLLSFFVSGTIFL